MLEGSRDFDIAWGTVTGTLCLLAALPVLVAYVWRKQWSMFGPQIDPKRRLQLGYGIVTIGMGFTNYLCRYIPHNYLLGVHEGWFVITLILLAVVGPRSIALVAEEIRRRSLSRKAQPGT
jgi:hypothetical protein